MALGVGALVGFSVRRFGKGIEPVFGFAGAGLSLIGCLIGNLLAVTAIAAAQEEVPFSAALAQLDFGMAVELMAAFFSPIDVLFYAIAVYEGYKLSFRRLSPVDLGEAPGAAPGPA